MENRFEQLLQQAIKEKCTDIHFSINEEEMSISMRTISGLKPIKSSELDLKLFNYLQYQAHMDISSHKPQSGSFNRFFNGKYYDFRFAVIQTLKNRSGVLRILNCHEGLSLQQLTFDKEDQNLLFQSVRKRSGLIVFSGLTGSGKTTTMYSLLKMIQGKTIYSLEDPIEVLQDNITQLEINNSFGYDEGIRQILRHNPDILMIGEIRDEITAKMAVRAALTGVLVVCSLHSHSTVSAIHRLLELGVHQSDLLDVGEDIFNQRLVKLKNRKGYCCIYDHLSSDEIREALLGNWRNNRLNEKIRKAIELGVIDDE